MREQQRDDLVTAVVEVIAATIATGVGWESPDPVRAIARAVLASGLVRPAADSVPREKLLALLARWDDPNSEPNNLDTWATAECAEQLRALVGGES